jgi:hypothetical protein
MIRGVFPVCQQDAVGVYHFMTAVQLTRGSVRHSAVWAVLLGLVLLPLIAHLVLGQHNRALADDYCFTIRARELGMMGTLDYWYNNWTGTYASTFFQSVVGLLGAWQWVPGTLVVLWFAALWGALYRWAVLLDWVPGLRVWGSAILSAVTVGVTMDGTLNVYQSMYWTSGAISYSAPLIVWTVNLGVIAWAIHRTKTGSIHPLHYALIGGLAMFTGGFTPLSSVAHVAFFVMALLATLLIAPQSIKRSVLSLWVCGLVFAVIAFAILLLAPGNTIRRSYFPEVPSLAFLIENTVIFTVRFFVTSPLLLAPFLVGMGLSVWAVHAPPGFSKFRSLHRFRRTYITVFAGVVVIAASFLAALYAMTFVPPPRAFIVPRYALVLMFVIVGYLVGTELREILSAVRRGPGLKLVLTGIALAFVGIQTLNTTRLTLEAVPGLSTFAQEWDARDAYLREQAAAAAMEVTLTPFTVNLAEWANVDDVGMDAGHTTCAAEFYGVGAIRVAG